MANPNSSAQRSFAAEPYDSVAATRVGVTVHGSGASNNLRYGVGHVYFPAISAQPTATWQEGMVYFDTTSKKLRVYNGTLWVDLH